MALRVTLDFTGAAELGGLFEVHRLDFTDAVSELFEAHLVMFSPDATIDPRGLIGRSVVIHLLGEALLPVVRGIVRQARRHTAEATGATSYELTVVPPHWLLTRGKRTKIFQGRTAAQIAADVLGGDPRSSAARLSLPAPTERLGSLPVHDYRVQYGETDHDFVFRVLADDGIASFFDHEKDAWVLCDDTTSGGLTVEENVPFDPSNLTPGGPALLRWCEVADVETAVIARRDFDFEKPLFGLQAVRAAPAKSLGENEASLEDYEYEVGDFADDGAGAGLSARRLDAARAMARRARMWTNFAIGAGARLTVTGPDIAGDWLVVRSRTALESNAAGGTGELHEIVAIPAQIPFRPTPLPRPRIHGIETAFVVGDTPAGTVDTDVYGRVKVELRWDRRDLGKGNPTRWVRVAQAWAGAGFGLVTLPRVGDEVLVAYSQGDPDQPLVVGRVHNAVNVTPLALPEQDRTKAIWKSQSFNADGPAEGFNMILMDDNAGKEVLKMRAQKDFDFHAVRHSSTFVGANQTTQIGGSQSEEVIDNQSSSVGGDETKTVVGSYSVGAKGITLDSSADFTATATGIMKLSAGAERYDYSAQHWILSPSIYLIGQDNVWLAASVITLSARSHIDLMVGGSSIRISDGGITITSSGPVEVNGSPVKLNC